MVEFIYLSLLTKRGDSSPTYHGQGWSLLAIKDKICLDTDFLVNLRNLSPEAVQQAGEIQARLEKKGEMTDFRDILIGCVALREGFSLKTYNLKHFSRIPELFII